MSIILYRQKTVLDFLKSCDEAIARDPDNHEHRRLRGLLLTVAGEYDKAIDDFQRIINNNPGDTSAYYLKSSCHCSKGEFDLAKRDYMRALNSQQRTKFKEEEINKAVILDDEDLKDIKEIIEFEMNEAITHYLTNKPPFK